MKPLSPALLDDLTTRAAAAPRQRMNANLHAALDDPIQRLAIAMEPDTYVRPHRHPVWEMLIPLRGQFLFTAFDDAGNVAWRELLGGENGVAVMEFDAGTWHTVSSLVPGSIIFEVKPGPYLPVPPEDLAAWSPPEGSDDAKAFVATMRASA
jgi:cupin fold WbuC family metalloprotein